jgi:hypothetical protein
MLLNGWCTTFANRALSSPTLGIVAGCAWLCDRARRRCPGRLGPDILVDGANSSDFLIAPASYACTQDKSEIASMDGASFLDEIEIPQNYQVNQELWR